MKNKKLSFERQRTFLRPPSFLLDVFYHNCFIHNYVATMKFCFSVLECVTSYAVHHVISMWLSLMTMSGKQTVIIYSSEIIYQTLISLKASS